MYQLNPTIDPLVEILRLAYRRGLALRQEQEKRKAGNVPFPTDNRTVIKREGSPASEPRLDPSNRNGKEDYRHHNLKIKNSQKAYKATEKKE